MFEMMKTSKALHFCALQPNAKQWNHQSRLRSPVKLHQLEQVVAIKVSHHLVCMCIQFLYYTCIKVVGNVLDFFVWPINLCLMSSV